MKQIFVIILFQNMFVYLFIMYKIKFNIFNIQPIWPNWTNKTIDETIEKKIVQNIEFEFLTEISNSTYHLPLINVIGCLNSYISFICKKNFLPCDMEKDLTYPICKKTCKKFLSKCETYSNLCDSFPEKNCV